MGSFIRLLAIVTSAIVLLGFALFAVDQMSEGSKTQQDEIDQTLRPGEVDRAYAVAPDSDEERAREAAHGDVREVVDDANDILLTPFADVTSSSNAWIEHAIPAVLALLLYGLGLGFLANFMPKQRAHGGDWRTAGS